MHVKRYGNLANIPHIPAHPKTPSTLNHILLKPQLGIHLGKKKLTRTVDKIGSKFDNYPVRADRFRWRFLPHRTHGTLTSLLSGCLGGPSSEQPWAFEQAFGVSLSSLQLLGCTHVRWLATFPQHSIALATRHNKWGRQSLDCVFGSLSSSRCHWRGASGVPGLNLSLKVKPSEVAIQMQWHCWINPLIPSRHEAVRQQGLFSQPGRMRKHKRATYPFAHLSISWQCLTLMAICHVLLGKNNRKVYKVYLLAF